MVSLTYGVGRGREAAFWRSLRNLLDNGLSVEVVVTTNPKYVRDSLARYVKANGLKCRVQMVGMTVRVVFNERADRPGGRVGGDVPGRVAFHN